MTASSPYASRRTIETIRWLLSIIGVIAAIAGPAYAIVGATQAPTTVRVPVELSQGDDDDTTAPGRFPVTVPGLPESAHVVGVEVDSGLELAARDSTVVEQLLARGDAALLGLAVGVGALLLRPVLGSLASGQAFSAGNARRIGGLAVAIVAGGFLGPLLPQIATIVVLERLDLAGSDGPFTLGVTFSLTPLLGVALLLVLAEAFRQGERLTQDVEGLV